MTSLSSLPASFSAEKRCKGKHFFSFHQNFFQVFFGEVFRSGRTAARKIPPQAGKDASLSSFRGFRSRKRVQKYALYPIPQHTPQGFTTETFWKESREEGKTVHLYIRAYAITFIYAAQTRRNFYPKGRKFLFGALPVTCGRNRQRFGLRF